MIYLKKDNKQYILQKLKDYSIKNKNICFSLLFGSYPRGENSKTSDIDLALYFYNEPAGIDLLYLVSKISDICHKDVDVVVLNKARPFLRHQVMKSSLPIIIKDRHIYIKFREDTISGYDRYRFISGINCYD